MSTNHLGRCTNLPTNCTQAATQALQAMPASDARCNECGARLMAADSGGGANRNNALIVGAAVAALLLLGVLAWFFMKGKDEPAEVVQAPPPATAPATPPAPSEPPPAPAAPVPAQATLRLAGSNTLGSELVPALLQAFYGNGQVSRTGAEEQQVQAQDRQGQSVRADVSSHGSGTAFSALAKGEADIGMASRRIKPEEARFLAEQGDLTQASSEYVIGLDGVAVIVNPANPLRSLSLPQVARVFSGAVRNWKELGGADAPIALHARDDKSGTFDTFQSLALGSAKLDGQATRHEDSHALSSAVAADPNAIGFIGLPFIGQARALALAASEGAQALVPNRFTVATEDYPLSRRLYLYVPSGASAQARQFAEFAASPAGQAVVKAKGFIDQIPETKAGPEAVSYSGENRGYQALVAGSERMSTNVRFEFGSSRLDSKAQRDLQRITDLLGMRLDERHRLVLVGFADNRGSACANDRISRERAQEAARQLGSFGVKADVVEGLGSDAPVADNGLEAGREKNRRVELWIAPLDKLPRFAVRSGC